MTIAKRLFVLMAVPVVLILALGLLSWYQFRGLVQRLGRGVLD